MSKIKLIASATEKAIRAESAHIRITAYDTDGTKLASKVLALGWRTRAKGGYIDILHEKGSIPFHVVKGDHTHAKKTVVGEKAAKWVNFLSS